MRNAPNRRNSGQESEVIGAAEKAIDNVFQIVSYIRRKFKRGPVALAVIIVAALLVGGVSWNVIRSAFLSNGSSAPAATALSASVADVGFIDDAVIMSAYIKSPPGSLNQEYMFTVQFPNPAECDNLCEAALADILGPGVTCAGQSCTAEFEDVDEGAKTNSGDIWGTYSTEIGKEVLIVFSGKRDQNASQYANILLIRPSGG
jgi:hypothetical protein